MAPARSDDSHDERYTHDTQKTAQKPDTRVMLYGRPYVKDFLTVQDTAVAKDPQEAAEMIASGSWKETTDGFATEVAAEKAAKAKAPKKAKDDGGDAGFSRLGTMLVAAVLAVLSLTAGLVAQTALTATTLSSALAQPAQGSQAQTVNLTSGTSVVVGTRFWIDNELMAVTALNTNLATQFTVARGQGGTRAVAHASGANVYLGPAAGFFNTDVAGVCVSTALTYLPHINTSNGNVYTCAATSLLAGSPTTYWARLAIGGIPSFAAGAPLTGWTYTTAGAITVQPGTQWIGSAGALAMTLVNPTTAQNGMIMSLFASTAQAHTITYTAGFNGGTTARDVCTLGGAIGDGLTIYASGGIWYILNNKNCTLG